MNDDELEEQIEDEETGPCEYCGFCPCKCVQLNNEIDEYLDGSAYYIN